MTAEGINNRLPIRVAPANRGSFCCTKRVGTVCLPYEYHRPAVLRAAPGSPAGADYGYTAIPIAGDDGESVFGLHCAAVGLGGAAQCHLAAVARDHGAGVYGFEFRLIRCRHEFTLRCRA